MSKPRKKGICVYCGSSGPITHDHIPPKSLFMNPRPKLITVYACQKCHKYTAKDDEYFRAVLSLKNTANTKDAAAARDSFIRSMQRYDHSKFRKSFLSGVRSMNIMTPAGLHIGKRIVYEVDLARLGRVMSRIIKGLYYCHFYKRLPSEVSVSSWTIDGLNDLDDDGRDTLYKIIAPLSNAKDNLIGDGNTFCYRYITADREYCSAWLLTVYGSTIFLGLTVLEENIDSEI